jgi:hypothetical protein
VANTPAKEMVSDPKEKYIVSEPFLVETNTKIGFPAEWVCNVGKTL